MISTSKLTVLVMAAAMSAGAQTQGWELGSPDAKLLMGIDLKNLRESPLGKSIREQMKAQPAPAANAQTPAGAQAMLVPFQAMAMGLLEQIDRIYLSSPANPSVGAKNNPPFLLVVEGRLPMAQVKPFLQGTSRQYRTANVYRTSKTDTTSVALLEGGTLLMGDEKSVLAAIDRRAELLFPVSGLLARAQLLASTHDVWMIADESLSKFQPANTSASNPLAAQIAAQIKGLEMGVAVHDGLDLVLNLTTESDAAAAQMATLLSSQIQAGMLAQGNRPEVAEMVRKIQIGAEGNHLHMSLAVSKDEFERQLRTLQAERAMTVAGATQPAPRPVKPATPGKITIYGLEGGPRTIEANH